jgi:uncharacterized membrane protein YtjA (UPF0391 family)
VGIADVLFLIGLALGVIEVIRSEGKSLIAWAVVFVCVGLLAGLVL